MFFNKEKKEKSQILKIKADVLPKEEAQKLGFTLGNSEISADYVIQMTNPAGEKWYIAAINGFESTEEDLGRTAQLALFDSQRRERHSIFLGEELVLGSSSLNGFSPEDRLRRDKSRLKRNIERVSSQKCDDSLKKLYKRALFALDESVSEERERAISKYRKEQEEQKEKNLANMEKTKKEVKSFLASFMDKVRS